MVAEFQRGLLRSNSRRRPASLDWMEFNLNFRGRNLMSSLSQTNSFMRWMLMDSLVFSIRMSCLGIPSFAAIRSRANSRSHFGREAQATCSSPFSRTRLSMGIEKTRLCAAGRISRQPETEETLKKRRPRKNSRRSIISNSRSRSFRLFWMSWAEISRTTTTHSPGPLCSIGRDLSSSWRIQYRGRR